MLIVKLVFSYYMDVLVHEVSVLLPYQIMSLLCFQTVTFQDLVYLWSALKGLLSQLWSSQ